MPKIIAVCPVEYPGVNAVFRHGAALGLWEHINLKTELPKNDFVILGAWHPSYEEYLDKHQCTVYLTSTFAQMEFSHNQIEITNQGTIQKLLQDNRIKAVLSGWQDTSDFLTEYFPARSFYCPYPFSEEFITSQVLQVEKSKEKEIGIFLPFAPRKNILNQILAASSSGLKTYTNLPFDSLKNIHKVEWLSEMNLYTFISKVTMTLHCTFTESFCYSTAESLVLGTIPIVSIQIADNLGLTESIVCKQVDSVKTIKEKILEIAGLSETEYKGILEYQKFGFRERIKANTVLTKDVLDKVANLVVK